MQAVQQVRRFSTGSASLLTRVWNAQEYFWITRPLAAFLITRVIVLAAAYFAEVFIPGATGEGLYHVDPNNIFLDVWARWDSGFYLSIVGKGYFFELGQQSSVAFFPLYPLLMSFLMPIAGSALAAGVLISNACLLGGLVFLYRLTELEFGDARTAWRTVFYIAAFPTAFFFSAVYTESTFLFMSVATFYFARKRLWAWAVLFGLLTSSSRIIGVSMLGIVGLEWMRSHGWTLGAIYKPSAWRGLLNGIRTDWFNLLILFIIPLGLVSYMLFLSSTFGDPFAFNTTQAAWGRQNVGFWRVIPQDLGALLQGDFLRGNFYVYVVFDLAAFFAVVILAFIIWRRLGATYAIYCLLSVVIPASSGTGSISRYALVVFPVFMLLGHWGRSSLLDRLLTIGFSVFLGMMTTVFVNWVFVA